MRRVIEGFHRDEDGDWVAELDCLHGQHVRHRPPFQDRAWVLTEAGRAERIGGPIDCPLCDRAELPDGLVLARTAGPFDAASLPPGLQKDHRVADHTWGCLQVLEGSLQFSVATDPPCSVRLEAPASRPIPPGVSHSVTVEGPVVLTVDFLVPAR